MARTASRCRTTREDDRQRQHGLRGLQRARHQYVDNPIVVGRRADPDLPRQRWAERLQHLPRRRRHLRPVCVNANPRNELFGLQSWTVGPGDGACFEFTLDEPGITRPSTMPSDTRPTAQSPCCRPSSAFTWRGGAIRREREGIALRCQRVEEQSRVPYLAGQQWMVRPSTRRSRLLRRDHRRRLRGRMSGAIRFILLGALSLASIGVGLRVATASQRRRAPSMLWRRSRPALRCCQGRRQMECSPWSFHRGPPRTSDSADGDIRCPTSSS